MNEQIEKYIGVCENRESEKKALSPLPPVVTCGSVAYLSLRSADETVSTDGLHRYLICS